MARDIHGEGVRQLLESGKDVWIRALDAGRAIAISLNIPRMDAHRLMWEAQRNQALESRIIDGHTCVQARDVRTIVRTWRNAR